ncbi:MAG: hypothetical protein MUC58_12155 [Rhizobiaceae bacterium]|jgi:hypothetical protein|nr:hypothetical protein [Rhizobiaceae bacterium]
MKALLRRSLATACASLMAMPALTVHAGSLPGGQLAMGGTQAVPEAAAESERMIVQFSGDKQAALAAMRAAVGDAPFTIVEQFEVTPAVVVETTAECRRRLEAAGFIVQPDTPVPPAGG